MEVRIKVDIKVEGPRWLRFPRRRSAKLAVALVAALVVAVPVAWATDVFADVPAASPHHDDVNAIRTAGITRGCNPPANDLYCPDQAVRRDQMASFLQRGLGRGARGFGPDNLELSSVYETGPSATVTLTVPGSGFALVNAMQTLTAAGFGGCPCLIQMRLRNVSTGAYSPLQWQNMVAATQTTVALTYLFPVNAGANTFVLEARSVWGTNQSTSNAVINALWVPFGSTGSSTLGAAAPEVTRSSAIPGR